MASEPKLRMGRRGRWNERIARLEAELTSERAELERLRNGIEHLAHHWLCLDHGGEEAERIRALLGPAVTQREPR